VVATLVATPIGMAVAWLSRGILGQILCRAAIHLPLVLPPV